MHMSISSQPFTRPQFRTGERLVKRFSALWSGYSALLVLSIVILLFAVQPAQAHTRTELGPYVVVVGWRNEPSIVGERNSLLISVHEGDTVVSGLESALDAEILYAGRIFQANLNPVDADGWYSIEIIPTIRGQYTLRLVGTIGDLDVDELIEPEEILPPNVLDFPETQPDAFALRESIDSLQSQLQTMTILVLAGVVLALLATLIALLSYVRGRHRPANSSP